MASIEDLTAQWLAWDKNPVTREEIVKLRDAANITELEKRLRKRIAFGTAGLRGRMAAGFSCMNSLTVIQASQGLARYVVQHVPDAAAKGVVIGHDTRHNSEQFAHLVANAFAAMNVKIWWYGDYVPTPLVSFGLRHLGAAAGVMITASHNPAQDNGYKVYWSNGCQINTPVDVGIAESIESNLEPWETAWADYTPGVNDDILAKLTEAYTSAVVKFVTSNQEKPLSQSFTYTPMHGVGFKFLRGITKLLNVDGFSFVKEQIEPDPDFPTVAFPNPEEAGALDLAMSTADANGVTLVLSSDPDADRFAAAEKINGVWTRLTGDQVGVLLASYVLEELVTAEDKPRTVLLNSAVSTCMLEKMAVAEGAQWQETLTGFKWLGNVAKGLRDQGLSVPFAFEEALGYMFTEISYDKDGLSTAAIFLAADANWRAQGLTPFTKLQQLYAKYGFFESINTYFTNPDPALTKEAFDRIRSKVAEHDQLGDFKILRTRDLTYGADTGTSDKKAVLPADPGSQMLTFWLDHDTRFTMRGSGTEPKVKIYLECSAFTRDEAIASAKKAFLALVTEWIYPFAPSFKHAGVAVSSSGVDVRLSERS